MKRGGVETKSRHKAANNELAAHVEGFSVVVGGVCVSFGGSCGVVPPVDTYTT
jgi:hypothetical protein